MDYGKISAILTELYDNKEAFIEMGYIEESYFIYLDDALILATMVNADWAEPTDLGKEQIFIAWKTLCDIRELDHTVIYDKVVDFFMAQEVVG